MPLYQPASAGTTAATQGVRNLRRAPRPTSRRVGSNHPNAATGWIKCDAAGNINVSYNVTSFTDTGTGVVTVTWDVDS